MQEVGQPRLAKRGVAPTGHFITHFYPASPPTPNRASSTPFSVCPQFPFFTLFYPHFLSPTHPCSSPPYFSTTLISLHPPFTIRVDHQHTLQFLFLIFFPSSRCLQCPLSPTFQPSLQLKNCFQHRSTASSYRLSSTLVSSVPLKNSYFALNFSPMPY